jgi:exonuclease SbcD
VTKILHAADLHIDSPLGGLVAYDGAPVDEIRGATRRATENLVKYALDHDVDLVVLAGDIFDGDWRDFNTGLFWIAQLSRLKDAGIPVVLVAGNHDASSEISRSLILPPNVTRLAEAKPETTVFDELGVAVTGQGYATRAVTTDLAAGFPQPDRGLFNIGLLHTSLDGRPGHANYAPCTVEGLRSLGYDYLALGHIHQREVVSTDPHIVYPGNLQGRHAREVGPKGATLVTVESGQVESLQHLELDAVRWHRCEVNASTMTTTADVLEELRVRLSALVEGCSPRLAAARVVVTGPSAAHEELWRDREGLLAEVRAMSITQGRLWIEKVDIATSCTGDMAKARAHGAVGQLAERIEQLKAEPASIAPYEELFADLRRKVGADARGGEHDATDTRRIATPDHLVECLNASLELVVSLLSGEAA